MIEIRKVECSAIDRNAEYCQVVTIAGHRLQCWFKQQYRYKGTFIVNDIAKDGWSEWQEVKIVEAE